MNYKFALDSYAWIEYAIGSQMGEFINFIIKYTTCITPSIVIAELSDKFHRENNLDDWRVLFKFIKHNSTIISLNGVLAEKSGGRKKFLRDQQESKEKKIGLADAIIYETALSQDCKLVTGDEHFANTKNVIYLKKIDKLEKIQEEISRNL
ncbi:MAG: PIN domain-containing protein [Promethearchaeota archaeon]